MTTAPVGHHLTWEEFLELPDEPRYRHAELVDGELVLVNPSTWLHQHVVGEVFAHLRDWVRCGPARGTVTMEPPVQITNLRGDLPDVASYGDGRARPLWLIDPEEPAAFVLRAPRPAVQPAEFVLVEELAGDGVLASPLLPDLQITLSTLLP